jgi:signal transduction histidine kinase
VIGVINVESHTPAAFKQQDRLNLELLAAQAAIAIQNGRAFDDLHKAQGTIAARTNLVYWGMESAVWRHAINNYALTISEQAGLFRSNLTKRTLSQADKQKLFERLDMIQNLAQRIQDKRFTPPLSSEEGVEPVLIGQLVRERANQLVDRYGNPGILQPFMLEPDSQVMVWASPEWLRLAVDILVDNAVKAVHGRPQQQVTVGVCLLPNQREVKIFVRDTGPGISLEYQEILGDEYIPRSPGRPGMGLGLAMAKMIARTYQGKLEIASTGAQGTEMTITLPVYQPAPAGGAKG